MIGVSQENNGALMGLSEQYCQTVVLAIRTPKSDANTAALPLTPAAIKLLC